MDSCSAWGAPPGQDFVLTEGDSLGWRMLEATLRKAMRDGMSPAMLALKIDLLVLGGASAAHGRNKDSA